jgi:hypothetical protein
VAINIKTKISNKTMFNNPNFLFCRKKIVYTLWQKIQKTQLIAIIEKNDSLITTNKV